MKQIEDKSLQDLCKFLDSHRDLGICGVNIYDLANNYLELVEAQKQGQADVGTMVKGSIKKHVEPEVKLKKTNNVQKLVRRYKKSHKTAKK